MKQRQIEEYEVNPFTLFIKPKRYGNKVYSQIIEVEDEFLSPLKPLDIIKNSCFGSDYEGCRKGSMLLINAKHKIPIAIDPTNNLFFFPTASPNREECIWISLDHIKDLLRISPKETLIIFRNKQSYIIPVAYSTIQNQISHTATLKWKLMQRIEYNQKKSFYLMNRPLALEASEKSPKYGKNSKSEE
ncbi:competence protein ComK [Neobacillus sp. FSL H8-0543]|uniref:competence protein ComK n=1 Tax=Neobacillus sp. FSL H8-0543 TaxID=2954672 RepID=UPI0031593007